jgi:hypothetical protein
MEVRDIAGDLEGRNPAGLQYTNEFGNMIQYQLGRALVLENAGRVYEVKPVRLENTKIVVRIVYELTGRSKELSFTNHF